MSKGLEALHHPRIKSAKIDISAEGKHDIAYMFFDYTKQYAAIENELKEYEQYKAIEQELGIDLLTLFRALHSEKIYFKKQEYRKGKISYFKRFNLVKGNDNILRIIGEVKEQYTRNNYGCEFGIILDLKDYGKTWALTKEEFL